MKDEIRTEKELEKFIKKYLPLGNLSVVAIKVAVWEEDGAPLESVHKFQDMFMGYFENTQADLNDVLQISTKCWNAFPHRSLGGKSPNQMVREYKNNSSR